MSPISDKEGQILRFELERLLSYEQLLELAKSTGFCKRIRKLHPIIFLQLIIFSPCLHSHPTVAEIWRKHANLTESTIAYSSYVDRLNDASLRFFKAVLNECIKSPATGMSLKLRKRYEKFVTVYIQDSTIVRLNKKLADRFPATRSRKIAAGIKISYLLNVLANGAAKISFVPERTAEIKTLRVGPWVKGSLLLIDLGFFKYQLFARINENQGYFISRVKSSSILIIKEFFSQVTDAQKELFTGRDLLSVLNELGGTSIDTTVLVQLKRRSYQGKQHQELYPFHCVGRVHPETGEWHLYLTNLSGEEFTVDEIVKLYRFRWEIESLFDETKNECTLGDIKVTRDGAVMTLLYAALIRQMVLKRVYLVMRSLMSEKERNKLSPDLYGRVFMEQMDLLLGVILDEWKECEQQLFGVNGWQMWFICLSHHSQQYHGSKLTRDTFLGR